MCFTVIIIATTMNMPTNIVNNISDSILLSPCEPRMVLQNSLVSIPQQ